MLIDPATGLVDPLRDPDWLEIGKAAGLFKRLWIFDAPNLDIASVADADGGGVDATCTGVAVGDIVLGVSVNVALSDDAQLVGAVTAANTVRITLINHSGSAEDLAATADFKIAVLDVT